jgi:hypothetical protein
VKTYQMCVALLGMAVFVERAGAEVIVSVRQDNLLVAELGQAQRTAVRIFAGIGVAVEFRWGAQPKSAREGSLSIEMQLDAQAPPQFHAGVLAYAVPFGVSGTRIHIFCDRVRKAAPDCGTGAILGHVMAHEIAHVLQRVSRHSEEGVMKAHWEPSDYREMKAGTLPFDATDVQLIQANLKLPVAQSTRAVPPPR